MAERRPRIRVKDVAPMLGVSPRTVLDMANKGKLPGAARIGSLWTFDPAQIETYIEQLEAETARRYKHFVSPPVRLPASSSAWRRGQTDEEIRAAYELAIYGKGRKAKMMKKRNAKKA